MIVAVGGSRSGIPQLPIAASDMVVAGSKLAETEYSRFKANHAKFAIGWISCSIFNFSTNNLRVCAKFL